jgi:amylosucrase
MIDDHVADRSERLFQRDLAREADPLWFLRSDTVGYVCYVDRFAQTLVGVAEQLATVRTTVATQWWRTTR